MTHMLRGACRFGPPRRATKSGRARSQSVKEVGCIKVHMAHLDSRPRYFQICKRLQFSRLGSLIPENTKLFAYQTRIFRVRCLNTQNKMNYLYYTTIKMSTRQEKVIRVSEHSLIDNYPNVLSSYLSSYNSLESLLRFFISFKFLAFLTTPAI